MPQLQSLLRGAYTDGGFVVDGVVYSLAELLQYILDNLGGGVAGNDDVTEGVGAPSGAPSAGAPVIYVNTSNGNLYLWDGSQWNQVFTGTPAPAEDDVTEGSGAPAGAPAAGEPQIYQDTDTGNIYVWDGAQWVLLNGGGEDDITEGSGAPAGAPGAGEPQVYQDTDNGNLYIWDGAQWVLINGGGEDDITEGSGAPAGAPGAGAPQVYQDTDNGNLYVWNGAQWSLVTGGGGGLLQYEAAAVNDPVDDGAFVTATAAGITYERTGGAGQNTEGILTVPAGCILQGAAVHFSAGQAPGNTFYLNVDYQTTSREVNGSQDSVMPVLGTVTSKPGAFSDGSPATNYVHSGTPLQIGIAQVDDNGSRTRIRYKITNYSQQVGSNASILTLIFP